MNEQPTDREFEDFLRRRRPLFRGGEDDSLEPPAELDRIVLRQARDAIQPEAAPPRLYRAPRWGASLAIAATLVLGLAFVFKAGMTTTDVRPQVTIENIAQRVEIPAAAPASAAPAAAEQAPVATAGAPVVVDLGAPMTASAAPAAPPAFVSEEEARRHAPPPPGRVTSTAGGTVADASALPAWRRDSGSWLAEIERLRASGNAAQADAEMAEYNRQHRAMAVSPDR